MRAKGVFAGIFGLSVAIVVLAGAWYLTFRRPPEYCQLSGRLIHPHMLTTVRVDGKKLYACCARCALTYALQTGKHVEIVSVTDYVSGRKIDAGKAYFVNGSRIAPCSSPALQREEGGTPSVRMFDRCSPSLIAFARQDQARAFMGENGGTLTTLNELQRKLKASDDRVSPSRSQP